MASDPEPEYGTLIVTYETEDRNEKIDRVRFWLINEQNKQTLYPKGATFVDDKEKNSRMVVIEDLNPGMYTLEFLIPNLDGKFEEIPAREVMIVEGEVSKVDQGIEYKKPSKTTIADSNQAEEEIQLANSNDQPEESATEPLSDENEKGNHSKQINTGGKLIVSYELSENTEIANQVMFRLINKKGDIFLYPQQDQNMIVALQSGKMVIIQHIPTGQYELEFFLKDNNRLLASQRVTIEENRTKSIHQAISLTKEQKPKTGFFEKQQENHYLASLKLAANIPTAEYRLINLETREILEKKGREAAFKDLAPGTYEAHFFSYDPFFIPPRKEIIVLSPKSEIIKEVAYITLGKVKLTINIPATTASITPMHSGQPIVKKEIDHGEVVFYLPEGKYRITFRNEGEYSAPKPIDIDVKPLQTFQVNAVYTPSGSKVPG